MGAYEKAGCSSNPWIVIGSMSVSIDTIKVRSLSLIRRTLNVIRGICSSKSNRQTVTNIIRIIEANSQIEAIGKFTLDANSINIPNIINRGKVDVYDLDTIGILK